VESLGIFGLIYSPPPDINLGSRPCHIDLQRVSAHHPREMNQSRHQKIVAVFQSRLGYLCSVINFVGLCIRLKRSFQLTVWLQDAASTGVFKAEQSRIRFVIPLLIAAKAIQID
jgi:hypothetical protein